jgi:F-box-like
MHLPPEVWLEVFYWATYVSSDGLYTTKYLPFQAPRSYKILDASLKVKAVVVRVCRQWRALAMDMLYEDLRIRHGEQTLAGMLESCEERGRRVRRAELPYANTVMTNQYLSSVAILRRCPELEILVRPPPESLGTLRFEFCAEGLPLTSLKRLEWWYVNDAARSGGINSLDDVLSGTPNLQYLSIGGDLLTGQLRPPPHLPALTTLRLQRINSTLMLQLSRWSLPALVHIVVDNARRDFALQMLWETFGSQIQTIELGKHVRFCVEDHIASILRYCTTLKELNYHIYFTAPPPPDIMHSSLNTVRLHGQANYLTSDHDDWESLEYHFGLFSGPSLPSLKHIVLYGEWHTILTDDRFTRIYRLLGARNCNLELPDGTMISNNPRKFGFLSHCKSYFSITVLIGFSDLSIGQNGFVHGPI